jgi:hypothetical protein
MASNAKAKTTIAKRARENRLRERRLSKQAKKEARRQAPLDRIGSPGGALNATTTDAAEQHPGEAAREAVIQPLAEVD